MKSLSERTELELTEDNIDMFIYRTTPNSGTTGDKFDAGKNRLDLLPIRALESVGEAMTYGSEKYGDRNWEKGIKYNKLIGSTMRHLFAWTRGENLDKESGLNHLSHCAANVLMLLDFVVKKRDDLDNR